MSCTELTTLLQQKIADAGGKISFAAFMETVLYEPVWGYYFTLKGIGREGDFTTAPEISPLFARCIAKQCVAIFQQLNSRDVLELGAGSGQFAVDFILSLETLGIQLEHYYIFEISHTLRQEQKALLKKSLPLHYHRVIWLLSLPHEFSGIVIANEVLDAMPVHCFRIENHQVKERCVAIKKEGFGWETADPLSEDCLVAVQKLQSTYNLANGYESEINLAATQVMHNLSQVVKSGVMLLIDYGYGQREYYHPERRRGTLSCFYQHRYHTDPFQHIGRQDITAHVDFTRIVEAACDSGWQLLGFTTQAGFLLGCGLAQLVAQAEQASNITEQVQLHQAVKVLTLPDEMGERIKVLALGKQFEANLLGFEWQDRRRDL